MVKLIIIGTSKIEIIFNELKKSGVNFEVINKRKNIYRLGDYVFTNFLGSGVYPSKYFDLANCDEIIFLGMAYGFSGINVNDCCFPNEFSCVKFGWTDKLKMTLFKDKVLTDEFVFDETTDILKIDNKLKNSVVVKEFLSKEHKLNNHGKRVITSPFSLFTPYNTIKLQENGFNLGEMESYHVALMAKKRSIPFGCLLICTDNLAHDVREGLKADWVNMKKKLDELNLSNELLKKLKTLLSSGEFSDYNKAKELLKRYPDFYNSIKKELFHHDSDENIFLSKVRLFTRLAIKMSLKDN